MGRAVRWSIDRPTGGKLPAGYLLLLFRVLPEDGQFVGVCEELDIASCGDSPDAALRAVFDAVLLYLNTLEELGDRERVFKEKDLRISPSEPTEESTQELHPGEVVSPQRLVLLDR